MDIDQKSTRVALVVALRKATGSNKIHPMGEIASSAIIVSALFFLVLFAVAAAGR